MMNDHAIKSQELNSQTNKFFIRLNFYIYAVGITLNHREKNRPEPIFFCELWFSLTHVNLQAEPLYHLTKDQTIVQRQCGQITKVAFTESAGGPVGPAADEY